MGILVQAMSDWYDFGFKLFPIFLLGSFFLLHFLVDKLTNKKNSVSYILSKNWLKSLTLVK